MHRQIPVFLEVKAMNQETYNQNKERLIKILIDNTEFEIDDQRSFDLDQVAVWCKSYGKNWSICFQNGDMNGDYKGCAVFTNAGANDGLKELRDILKEKEEFRILDNSDDNPTWPDLWLDQFVNDFVDAYAESVSADNWFDK